MQATTRLGLGTLAAAILAVAVPCAALADTPTAPKTTYVGGSPFNAGGQNYLNPPVYPTVRLGFEGRYEWQRGGMAVYRVRPYSQAKRIGLQWGDVIVQINGRPITSQFAYDQALQASQGYGRMLVRDRNTGYLVNVSMTPPGNIPGPFPGPLQEQY